MIRTIIVDDEAPARQRIRDLLGPVPDVRVVAECSDGPEAVAAIEVQQPSLIFLDVQMPEMDGFEVLEALNPDSRPVVIFVTAYDRHAVAAFDAHAVDYLLKPYTAERFGEALDRARARLRDSRREDLGTLAGRLFDDRAPRRLPVRVGASIRFVDVDEIRWLEADGNYVVIHTGEEAHRVRTTLKRMVARLERAGLLRIHQSYAVHRAHIRELKPWTHGEFVVVLEGGKTLVSSRSYSAVLRDLSTF